LIGVAEWERWQRGRKLQQAKSGNDRRTHLEKLSEKFIGHKRESSGFFSKKNLPKPKKGPNLFFEVEIVSLA
jgi:hypothetical protein